MNLNIYVPEEEKEIVEAAKEVAHKQHSNLSKLIRKLLKGAVENDQHVKSVTNDRKQD